VWTSIRNLSLRARALAACAILAGTLAAGGCRMAPTERNQEGDPDARLASALSELDKARSSGRNNNTVASDESVIMDPESARLRFDNLAVEYPAHVPTLTMCALLSFEAGEFEKSAAYADRALALQPEHNFAAILRARVALQEGNLPRARDVLSRQIAMTPESPYLHEMLASVHYFSGELAAAEQELRLAEHHGSEPARLAYLNGLLAEKRGNPDDAKKLFAKAVELDPGFEEAQSQLLGLSGPAPAPAPAPAK
jgi:tetratricopeptide (TPR) repeat protein